MELATIFPSKYIKAADLKGHEPTVVIARAEIEKLGEDSKLVLYFQGKEKGLVTNRTNADRIAYLYGQDTDDWIGKEIVLYTDMVNFQGKVTEAIRVKPPAPRTNGGARAVESKSPPKALLKNADDGAFDDAVPF
jgi:hypothetical protein